MKHYLKAILENVSGKIDLDHLNKDYPEQENIYIKLDILGRGKGQSYIKDMLAFPKIKKNADGSYTISKQDFSRSVNEKLNREENKNKLQHALSSTNSKANKIEKIQLDLDAASNDGIHVFDDKIEMDVDVDDNGLCIVKLLSPDKMPKQSRSKTVSHSSADYSQDKKDASEFMGIMARK